jgi:hypothetical protein
VSVMEVAVRVVEGVGLGLIRLGFAVVAVA